MEKHAESVEEYISRFPKAVQVKLNTMRATIFKHAPEAIESISYGMPAYKTNKKPLVYFAAYKHHIGFYATPNGHLQFAAELANYKQGKGSVQFPINEPLPIALIAEIVKFKSFENAQK
jgi:uncharacterized protein YdhG (YjbR/CyaY superfamily)